MKDSGAVVVYTLNNGDTKRVVVLTYNTLGAALDMAINKAANEGWAPDIDESADIHIGRITDLVED